MGAPGKTVLTASGKRGLLSSGKAAVFDDAGGCAECCNSGDDCLNCTGTTPRTLEVVISGVAECSCLYEPGAGSYDWASLPSVTPNGTFTLTQDEVDPCQWYYEAASTGTINDRWPSDDCTGDPWPAGEITVSAFWISLEVVEGEYRITSGYDYSIGGGATLAGAYFKVTVTESTPMPCSGFGPASNEYADCQIGPDGRVIPYYGGSATIGLP